MQLKCGLAVSSVLIFFLSFPVYSQSIDPAFQELKSSAEKYEIKGTVCEQVARLELEQKYPEKEYSVENGIAFQREGRTLGELDVVIFRKSDNKVILIGEVKCWQDLHEARKKAVHQRENFRFYLRNGGRGIDFHKSSDPSIHFNPSQFGDLPPFILISQDGGHDAGFDLSLPYTLDQLMQLREMLIDCQDSGKCPSPLH
ncbi:MAG: hypothetical protein ABIQ95_12980 [Bdellovibrionia bacterium]